jgi:hypothetical protein
MNTDWTVDAALISLSVALGVGLLIGVERERRKGDGPARAAAGVRTFAITALIGALAMLTGSIVVVGIAGAGLVALVAVSYLHSGTRDPGLTTEVALLATFLVGLVAVSRPLLAAGVGTAIALLLASRSALHGFARRELTENEVRDGILLAAAALIVLPALPPPQARTPSSFRRSKMMHLSGRRDLQSSFPSVPAGTHVGYSAR